jgi:hypothetical protein
MKKLIAAALAAIGLAVTAGAASAQICAVGIVAAGFYTGFIEHRELTEKEAMFCGIYHETTPPAAKKTAVKAKHAKKKMKKPAQ